MELVQLAVQSASRSNGRVGNKDIPNYLKPSTGSCHHACKYGGAHAFQERDDGGAHGSRVITARRPKPPPAARKQQQPAAASSSDNQKPIRARSLVVAPRKLFGSRGGGGGAGENSKNAADDDGVKVEMKTKILPADENNNNNNNNNVEWKDIVAYDQTVVPAAARGGSNPELGDKQSSDQGTIRGKKKLHPNPKQKAKINPAAEQAVDGGLKSQNEKLGKSVGSKTMATSNKVSSTEFITHKTMNADTKSRVKKPPRGTKKPTVLVAIKKKAVADREQLVDGYQPPLSPSLLQKRASLLRDLEEEMRVHGEPTTKNTTDEFLETTTHSLGHRHQREEELGAAAETESSRPVISAHRRVKSMTMSTSRTRPAVRFPFLARQASKNSAAAAAFKLRSSKSSRAPPPEQETNKTPARLRSRRGSVGGSDDIGGGRGGFQLRIRSLRRRGGASSGGGTGGGFVVPAVSLRHQKTLEKKRSQRLYNSVIEETASKLVKTRKSRVKALVGAFESVISKIAK